MTWRWEPQESSGWFGGLSSARNARSLGCRLEFRGCFIAQVRRSAGRAHELEVAGGVYEYVWARDGSLAVLRDRSTGAEWVSLKRKGVRLPDGRIAAARDHNIFWGRPHNHREVLLDGDVLAILRFPIGPGWEKSVRCVADLAPPRLPTEELMPLLAHEAEGYSGVLFPH